MSLHQFREFRERMNDRILAGGNLCAEEGLSDDEILESLGVGLVVGGSIVIPHLRRAVATLDEIRAPSTP